MNESAELLVQDSLEDLARADAGIGAQAEAATSALREARFTDADPLLAVAEESAADGPTRARLRSVRAQAALVRGDAMAAARHYVAGARYVEAEEPDSTEETMLFRSRAIGHLIRHADMFGGDGGWIDAAMELCNANIRRNTDVWNQGARQMDAGSAQLSAGRLKPASEALDLFPGRGVLVSDCVVAFRRKRVSKRLGSGTECPRAGKGGVLLSVRGGDGEAAARGKLVRSGGLLSFGHGDPGRRKSGSVGQNPPQSGLPAGPSRTHRRRRSRGEMAEPSG